MSDAPLSICLIAGEASGDLLGARLMAALRARAERPVVFGGVGGPLMAEHGLQSIFPMEELSVMGVTEVLPRLPKLLARIRQTADFIAANTPDIVVTIDAPDFVFRVVRRLRAKGGKLPRLIHYVAPSVWAWRPERAGKLAELYDGVICLLPFEPPYFEKVGLAARFCGHPLLDGSLGQGYGDPVRHSLQLPPETKLVGLLFGSRGGELKRMGPPLLAAAAEMARRQPGLHFLAPTLPHLEARVKDMLRGVNFPWKVIAAVEDKPDIFAALDVALATSGTVGLELALAGVPHLIGYRFGRATYEILRRKIRIKYAHLVNLLLDRPAVPEFLQNDARAGRLAQAGLELLTSDRARRDQFAAFREARILLAGDMPGVSPAAQAADFVLGITG